MSYRIKVPLIYHLAMSSSDQDGNRLPLEAWVRNGTQTAAIIGIKRESSRDVLILHRNIAKKTFPNQVDARRVRLMSSDEVKLLPKEDRESFWSRNRILAEKKTFQWEWKDFPLEGVHEGTCLRPFPLQDMVLVRLRPGIDRVLPWQAVCRSVNHGAILQIG